MCMIDLNAAFDMVDHQILLQVLQSRFGVLGSALAWFESYLQLRFCKVKVGTKFSTIRCLDCSVPEGSLAGPDLYSAYASTLQEIVPDNVGLNGFADDHSLKRSFKADNRKAEQTTISTLQNCLMNVKIWMDENRLKMNDGKTEFIMFGATKQLAKCKTSSIDVNKTVLSKSEVVKYPGTWMDCHLTFKDHIVKKCRTAMINLQQIKLIRPFLNPEACTTIMLGLVMSHLYYCNSILVGLPDVSINRMQRVQNLAAKVVLGKSKMDSTSECFSALHWLPICSRINHKILTLVHKSIMGWAPEYLQNLLVVCKPGRPGLRSALDTNLLVVPFVRCKTFAECSFSIQGPKMWNSLPEDLSSEIDTDIFKRK